MRPFPAELIAASLSGRKAVAVIDQNLSPGVGGITFQEIATALYSLHERPALVSVVGGLGGKNISDPELESIFRDLERAASGESVPSPRLLYTSAEQANMERLLSIARKEISS